jgi:hypothetical protein
MLPLCKIRVEYEMHFAAGHVYASGGSTHRILTTMRRHTQRQDLPNSQLLAKRVLATRASGYQCEDVEPTCPRNLGTPAVMFDVCIASNG